MTIYFFCCTLLSHSITNIIYTFTLDTFTDFSKQTTTEINFDTKINGKKITSSLGYWAVKRDVQETTASSNGKTKAKTRIIVAIMRIERYYSGVREELSMITDDALTLLDRQDYIGFFKSSSTNYYFPLNYNIDQLQHRPTTTSTNYYFPLN